VSSPWVETYTGKRFHLLDPQPDEIDIIDIAHALSQQCRYTGHTRRFYSVAEHSVHVSLLVSAPSRLVGLLHDASEAYVSDISRPVKMLTPVGPPYYEVEERIMRAIAAKFRFPWPPPKEVKGADNIMLLTEKDQLMTNLSWDEDVSSAEARATYPSGGLDYEMAPLVGYLPRVAERIFMERFDELTAVPGPSNREAVMRAATLED